MVQFEIDGYKYDLRSLIIRGLGRMSYIDNAGRIHKVNITEIKEMKSKGKLPHLMIFESVDKSMFLPSRKIIDYSVDFFSRKSDRIERRLLGDSVDESSISLIIYMDDIENHSIHIICGAYPELSKIDYCKKAMTAKMLYGECSMMFDRYFEKEGYRLRVLHDTARFYNYIIPDNKVYNAICFMFNPESTKYNTLSDFNTTIGSW